MEEPFSDYKIGFKKFRHNDHNVCDRGKSYGCSEWWNIEVGIYFMCGTCCLVFEHAGRTYADIGAMTIRTEDNDCC